MLDLVSPDPWKRGKRLRISWQRARDLHEQLVGRYDTRSKVELCSEPISGGLQAFQSFLIVVVPVPALSPLKPGPLVLREFLTLLNRR